MPDNGDGLLFSGTAARLETLFDQTRTFASLSFAVDAQAFSLHVQGNGATLAFGGPGIDLLQYDSISGFDASDFSFRGLDGTFALQGGRLEFITAAVPEPGAALLWLPGLLLVLGSAAARRPVAPVQAASRYIAWRPRPRAAICPTAAPIAPMCSGVVPQQPPTMFTSPCSANSRSRREVTSGVSSKPVSDIGLGSPAFG